jgi:peptidoglycan/LPS O-acetylase OafA/YrhL
MTSRFYMTNFFDFVRGMLRQPTVPATQYFYWLDFVRGCAAIAILVWHYQHFYYVAAGDSPIANNRGVQPFADQLSLLYHYGYYAVQLFWVISGFVFASVYANTPTTGRDFAVSRFARLYPLHFLTLLLVAGLQVLSHVLEGKYQIYPHNDNYHFVLHLFFVSNWGFEVGDSFNQPIWSVSVEIAIYIVFFVSLKYIFRAGIVGPLLMMALFAELIMLDVPGRFWECGMYFFAGTIVYVWLLSCQNRNHWNLIVSITGLMIAVEVLQVRLAGTGYAARIVLFCSVVLLAAAVDIQDCKLRGKKIAILGNLTYSLYLLHVPVQIAMMLAMDGLDMNRRALVSTGGFFIFFLASMILIAAVSYHCFELPMRKWVREKLRPAARVRTFSVQAGKE